MTNVSQKPMSIRFPAEVHDALKLNSTITGDSINDIVVDAVKAHLAATDWSDFDRRIEKVRDQYRVALDKLADL
jgi:predicted DNA-binding protein